MVDLLFAVNATAPIILKVAVGYFLKRIGLISADVAKAMNKLVFRAFLPAMLFLNMYKIESFSDIDFSFVWYTLGATVVLFLVALALVMVMTKDNPRRGALLQSVFRANYALVGIPLATSLFGEEGGIMATVLSAFIVPVFNTLAVVGLSLFSSNKKPSVKKVLVGIAKNPLTDSIALGFVVLGIRAIFVKTGITFRLSDLTPIYKTLSNLSSVATPLALIVLGAQFELSAIPELKRYITFGVLARNLAVPLIGLGVAYLFGCFSGAEFATFVAVFCTPVAVSSVPMAQEMDADVSLAGQLVVWTTVFSAASIFLASYILKLLGVF
ncbi:MAG: AEC family transporter [Clostridia bacterium]|nr:AEC family transporter [Clostridia bacterium]